MIGEVRKIPEIAMSKLVMLINYHFFNTYQKEREATEILFNFDERIQEQIASKVYVLVKALRYDKIHTLNHVTLCYSIHAVSNLKK